MLKNLTIGKKIGLGFSVVMLLLALVAVLSYTGVGGIVMNAGEVITGNKLDGNLAQKEVDHLNWANNVIALLTDENVTELSVETDDHQCGFGKWLYGEGRKEAEKQIPSIAPILKEIEGYHAHLHESAIEIGDHFKQADATLPGMLAAREADHLAWAAEINRLFLENLPQLEVTTDPNECALGKWLASSEVERLAAADPEFASLLEALKKPHALLHRSAAAIQDTWKQQHKGLIHTLRERLDDHRRWAAGVGEALLSHKEIDVQTDPTKCAFGVWLAGEECRQLCVNWPEFNEIINKVKRHHADLHESAVGIREHTKYAELAAAQATEKQISEEWNRIGRRVTTALEEGMVSVIDPAKASAEQARDVAAMVSWGAIDMHMNEAIIAPFLQARLLAATATTPEQWRAYDEQFRQVSDGLAEWATMIDGKDSVALQRTAQAVRQALQTWQEATSSYRRAQEEEHQYAAACERAREIYRTQTLPALHDVATPVRKRRRDGERSCGARRTRQGHLP